MSENVLQKGTGPRVVLHAREYYHEDFGNVVWWRWPINEPPVVGTLNDDDILFNEDHGGEYTHWSKLPEITRNSHIVVEDP